MDVLRAEKMMANAVAPWAQRKRYIEEPYRGIDREEQIHMCLNCTKPFCDNCLYGHKGKKGRPQKADTSLLEFFVNQKLSVKEICNLLNISRKSYYNYMKRLKKENTNESK